MSPAIIGHRGAAVEAPENSLAALDLAMSLGADALELDVRRSADGVLVVIHDPDLHRTSDRRGLITELGFEQIRRADLSCASDPGLPRWPERLVVPTLEEVFERFPGVEITVDVKDAADAGEVVRMIEAFRRVPETILYVDGGTETPSFRGYPGRRAACATEVARLAADPSSLRRSPERDLPEVVHTPLREAGRRLVSADLVTAIHDSGRAIQVWTIDDLRVMEWLAECGVDGIITNDVRAAAAHFGRTDECEERT
jgi:glycerophosphoryl diester phosphodiesterase